MPRPDRADPAPLPRSALYLAQRLVVERVDSDQNYPVFPRGTLAMPNLQHPRAYAVLFASTFAFMVCFAVWMMFGVIGIPIKQTLGLNNTQFGLLTSTPVLLGAVMRLPLGIWTDRFGGRIVMTVLLLAAALPGLAGQLRDAVLAVARGRVPARGGRRLLRRRHALLRALLPAGQARLRHGRVRRRHDRRGAQHVRRPAADRSLRLDRWCRRSTPSCSSPPRRSFWLAPRPTPARAQRRPDAAPATRGAQGPARMEALPVLLAHLRRLHRAVAVDDAILRAGVRLRRQGGGLLAIAFALPAGLLRAFGGWLSDRLARTASPGGCCGRRGSRCS